MIIDSFAGGGGASTGIEQALGRSPDVAINHSGPALALHAANHPETLHLNSNIWDVRPREVTKGRHVGLLWASPDCKHFSKAKGGAPRDRNIRDLAWVIVDWAEQVKPDVILMENVEEFTTWGPIGEDGQPIKEFEGLTFADWKARLRKAGYKLDHRELRACDYGAPTIRKRFFLIARRDGRRIVWPKPTHGDPNSQAVRKGKLLPWRTAAECIDWDLPCPSIFDSKEEIWEELSLRAVRPLKPNTLARVARGIHRYVIEAERPFIVNLTHGGRAEDVAEPFRTITGAHRGEKAVIVPSIVGCGGRAGQSRPRGGDEPFATVTAKADACIATATLAPSLTRFNGGATGQDLRDPMFTVTANSWIKRPGGAAPIGIITPILSQMYGSGGGNGDLGRPAPTVTAEGQHASLVAPHLMTMRNSGKPFNGADQPAHTITAGGAGLSLIAASIVRHFSASTGHGADQPTGAIMAGGGGKTGLLAATMVQTGYGERRGQAPRALDIQAPLGTVVAGGTKHAPIAAFLAQQNNDSRRIGGVNPGRSADLPMSTICASGSHQNVIAPWLAKYYGTGDGARHDEPCHTVTVRDRFAHMQAALAAPPFGTEHHAKARAVADLLRAHGLWDDREFVTLAIDGAEFVIVDVGMRMLTPRELFRAQGFPDDYVIDGVWDGLDTDEPTWHQFPKDVQVSCCGNSVCPPLAEALARANCGHLSVDQIGGATCA